MLYETDDDDHDEIFPESCSEDEILYETDSDADTTHPPTVSSTRQYAPRQANFPIFLGQKVCQKALQSLIGIRSSTITRLRNGEEGLDMKNAPKHPQFGFTLDRLGKWVLVLNFFYLLYHSCAETLPKPFKAPCKEVAFLEKVLDDDYSTRLVNTFVRSVTAYDLDPEAKKYRSWYFQ